MLFPREARAPRQGQTTAAGLLAVGCCAFSTAVSNHRTPAARWLQHRQRRRPQLDEAAPLRPQRGSCLLRVVADSWRVSTWVAQQHSRLGRQRCMVARLITILRRRAAKHAHAHHEYLHTHAKHV